jgi:hypothetical protein
MLVFSCFLCIIFKITSTCGNVIAAKKREEQSIEYFLIFKEVSTTIPMEANQ